MDDDLSPLDGTFFENRDATVLILVVMDDDLSKRLKQTKTPFN